MTETVEEGKPITLVEENMDAPTLEYTITDLDSNTHYEVELSAKNNAGWGNATKFVFKTAQGNFLEYRMK